MLVDRIRGRDRLILRDIAVVALEFAGIALAYLLVAKLGLQLASINASATPVWPATGLAIAAVLLRGYRIWPAILVAAFLANATTTGAITTSAAIAVGNMLEALVGGWLINRWAGGRETFTTPTRVASFALIVLLATMISATIGVLSLALSGFAEWRAFAPIWMTWWVGDVTGGLVVTPVIVLWALRWREVLDPAKRLEAILIPVGAIVVGILAFSPLIEQTGYRDPIGFLAILPLLWAALRRGQRDTATAALILAGFALWGALAGGGPFVRTDLNASFLLVLMFLISVSVPSLALSAHAAMQRDSEASLRRAHDDLDRGSRQRDRALADSERQFRLLVEGVTDCAIFMLDPAGNVISWNSGAQRIKGYTAAEIVGQHFSRFSTEEDRNDGKPARAIERATATGKHETEGWRVRRDGTLFWASVVLDAVRDEDGNLIGFAKITRDISERRNSQEALERAQEQLNQAQKMEAIGQVTGGIAHDFNNLLMIVSGHADILRRRVGEDPRGAKAVDAIQAAARRGESLTRQLLTFSRRQRLSPMVVDMRERIQVMRPMLESSLRGNIEFVSNLPPDLWPVEVDIGEFELALVNVAVNARDAMPNGGRFVLSAENVSSTPLSGSTQQIGDYVALDLTDTGTGIPPEIRAKIFDPFFTTKPIGKGTGLGLSQVHGFAHQSGGTVTIDSKVGVGTTITIYLPRSLARLAAAPDEVRALDTAAPAAGTILVVEDNAEVAEVTSALLEQLGYRVVPTDSAAGALRLLTRGAARFDLVFSDIVMPGMDGIELAREIRRLYPALPILLTSGYSDVAQTAQVQFAILRKPFELAALKSAIADALSGQGTAAGERRSRA